jgi:hypothetical protein
MAHAFGDRLRSYELVAETMDRSETSEREPGAD